MAETAQIDWSQPLPFVLADEILRGNIHAPRIPKSNAHNFIILARSIALVSFLKRREDSKENF